jgi:outer membrane protein assembly factor BamD (BamD/ComL family)
MLAQAKKHYLSGQYYIASTWLTRILNQYPATPHRDEVLIMLSKSFAYSGRDSKAAEVAQTLRMDDPKAAETLDLELLKMASQERMPASASPQIQAPTAAADPNLVPAVQLPATHSEQGADNAASLTKSSSAPAVLPAAHAELAQAAAAAVPEMVALGHSAPYAQADEATMLAQAKEHYGSGLYYLASTWLTRILNQYPATPHRDEVLLMLSKSFAYTGRDSKAAEVVRTLLTDYPKAAETLDKELLKMAKQEQSPTSASPQRKAPTPAAGPKTEPKTEPKAEPKAEPNMAPAVPMPATLSEQSADNAAGPTTSSSASALLPIAQAPPQSAAVTASEAVPEKAAPPPLIIQPSAARPDQSTVASLQGVIEAAPPAASSTFSAPSSTALAAVAPVTAAQITTLSPAPDPAPVTPAAPAPDKLAAPAPPTMPPKTAPEETPVEAVVATVLTPSQLLGQIILEPISLPLIPDVPNFPIIPLTLDQSEEKTVIPPVQPVEQKTVVVSVPEGPVPSGASVTYTLLVGEFLNKSELDDATRKINNAGLTPLVQQKLKKQETMIRLQVGEFSKKVLANKELAKLWAAQVDAFYQLEADHKFHVYAGTYADENSAASKRKRLAALGIKFSSKKLMIATEPTFQMTAGNFPTRAAAFAKAQEMAGQGAKLAVIVRDPDTSENSSTK